LRIRTKCLLPPSPATSRVELATRPRVGCRALSRFWKISEAPSVGKPVILYDAQSKGSMNYLNLAKEVLQKNNKTKISQEERILE